MSEDNGEKPMIELIVRLDPETGAIVDSIIPQNPIVALGLLEWVREALMMRVVRPSFTSQIVAPKANVVKMN